MNQAPSTRKQWATRLVEHLQEFCDNQHPGLLRVHWDDCDADDRLFWFHFRSPGLNQVKVTNSKQMRDASGLVRECWRETDRFFTKQDLPYEWTRTHSKWDSPIARYVTIDGRKCFDRYEDETWIRILSFYG